MKYRKLRIAWSVVWGIACLLLIALWVRSYWCEDQLGNYLVEIGGYRTGGYICRSREGNLLIGAADAMNNPGMIPPLTYEWYVKSQRIDGPLEPTLSNLSKTNALWRFGIRRFDEFLYINLPHWFPVSIAATLAMVPWIHKLKWRFSLRTMLIAMTLVVVGLGWIVYELRN